MYLLFCSLLTIVSNYSLKPALEGWFDCIKKVMRLKKKVEDDRNGAGALNDIDDFYVYLYDEEDLTNNQTTFNKGKKRSNIIVRDNTTRVLGFWCFNAGVGFKEIQMLRPRSILLTSGTLSPLTSF